MSSRVIITGVGLGGQGYWDKPFTVKVPPEFLRDTEERRERFLIALLKLEHFPDYSVRTVKYVLDTED
jgi:hypothetical protein